MLTKKFMFVGYLLFNYFPHPLKIETNITSNVDKTFIVG